MILTDLSREQDVGLTCQYVEVGPFKFVIDSGINPKKLGQESTPELEKIPQYELDFIVLTHCHLDHLGSLPLLHKRQPQAPILCSGASASLAPRMLRNSCRVMMKQKEEHNLVDYPLYTTADIPSFERALLDVPFKKTKVFEKGGQALEVTLYPAGHTPGTCAVLIEYKHRKLFFTSDVLFHKQNIVPAAEFPQGPFDTLVIETTRGATKRDPEVTRENEVERLIESIHHTLQHGGSYLVPAFAFGRMHEVLLILAQAFDKKQLPKVPVFASGLGLDLMDYFDALSKKSHHVTFSKKAIKNLNVKAFRERLEVGVDPSVQGIYVVSSGMLVPNTPSYALAGSMLNNHKNTIGFVGYCDPETPGGELLAANHEAPFVFSALDYTCPVRARVERFDLSSHADREEILSFCQVADPRAIVLNHGDPEAREWFEAELYDLLGSCKIVNPVPGVAESI